MEKIAFQGELGANSDVACRQYFPDMEPMPCQTFQEALDAIKSAIGLYLRATYSAGSEEYVAVSDEEKDD